MQLTRFSELGLRVLMYLTEQNRSIPVTIREVATQFDVPQNHLVKIVSRLSQLGWVHTVRGRHGGIELAMAPERLKLGEVVRQMENHPQLVNCQQPLCVLASGCHLQGILADALEAFYARLNQYTLADACRTETAHLIAQLHGHYLSQREEQV